MSLTRRLLPCALAGLLVGTVAGAEPQKRAYPTPEIARFCATMGDFATTKAQDRDAGVSLREALVYTYEQDQADRQPLSIRDWHQRLIHDVYASSGARPETIRRQARDLCILAISPLR